ncbi:hypothetical protein RR46_05125 [Papilio xuthus]|uniref:Uncharacterized protein n=1 Tax=Papilio xuthus TaxID=66420 RepID=A0A194QEM3_PAPXU|nr:hypothetical protein RR46_05125 [Papilio xuthus]
MIALSQIIEDDKENYLPPVISNNPHEKVGPENVHINFDELHFLSEKRNKTDKSKQVLIKETIQPVPKYPIALIWFPDTLKLIIDKTPINGKLTLINVCERLIYIHCCGLWNDEIRLGAHWCCYPKTRLLIAPGLRRELYVSAEPKETCPISEARVALQLAAAYKRDHVIAYFMVPMQVQFKNYVNPQSEEHSTEKLSKCS